MNRRPTIPRARDGAEAGSLIPYGSSLPDMFRLQGQLLLVLAQGHQAEAEIGFHQARHIARYQQAKSPDLRAAMSLSRQQQDKHAEARPLSVPIYGWFTEGVDTVDLQEAKALWDELF